VQPCLSRCSWAAWVICTSFSAGRYDVLACRLDEQTTHYIRRSATLRTYAGDTSLPGGKADPEDKTIEDTAVSKSTPRSCPLC
jgi:8-oxo-dGTP pyrophosphatase MutT (NUDIX family)